MPVTYPTNESLPASIIKALPDDSAGQSLWRRIFNIYAPEKGVSVAAVHGWAALRKAGYFKGADNLWRKLEPLQDGASKMPLPYDPNALSNIRPDQIPRLLGCLTHPKNLERRYIPLNELTAIQDRVDTKRVQDIADNTAFANDAPVGVVARFNGQNYILDGHNRIVGALMAGNDAVCVLYNDLSDFDQSLKCDAASLAFTFDADIEKINPEQRLVYGWASVVEKDGKPVVDRQGDVISPEDLVAAAHDFVRNSRTAKVMHQGKQIGDFVESLVFTGDLQKALGIDLGKVGWLVGLKVDDTATWLAAKNGKLPMFSIGGKGIRR